MTHSATELRWINAAIGHGVFATAAIPRGTITWVLDEFDLVLEPGRVATLDPLRSAVFEKYAYRDAQGNSVLCWDLGRYINHSCDPTSRGVSAYFEIALRDIAPGEQLTSDYAESNIDGGFECRCGSPRCRGLVRQDDLEHLGDGWDLEVAAALPRLNQVPQPLWPLVRDKAAVEEMLRGQTRVPARRHFRARA